MMDEALLEKAKRLHFIGIGGSGIFPMVQILFSKGYIITGSDNNEGDIIDKEREMGIDVRIGHAPANIEGADLIIYSAAIMEDNPELAAAREKGIPAIPRADVLGYITRQFEKAVCVSGTHGKTTTTAMLTQLLLESGLDPSAVIGGKLPAIGGYGRGGSSDIMTCEACEFKDTFLSLFPYIAVILNVDADHLDYFGSLENVIKSFNRFAALASGSVLINGDDANSRAAVEGITKPVITFGLDEGNDYRATNIVSEAPACVSFDLLRGGEKLTRLTLNVPGRHNVLNALAAVAAALEVGADIKALTASLPNFRGAGRRFEILGERGGVTIADDYAHHPTELEATLTTAMEMGYREVWAVFQPFTYTRTATHLEEFARTLKIADRVVMSEIMGGREYNTIGIYTKDLAELIPGAVWFDGFEEIADYVTANAKPGDLVLTLGCGDVYKCAKMMLARPQEPV